MGKFDGYLICTDLDGTFAIGNEICGENAEYVKYFQENGGLFTVSTGRLYNHLEGFKNFKPNCPVITHNGAAIYDPEKKQYLYQKPIGDSVWEVADFISKLEDVKNIWLNGRDSFFNFFESGKEKFGDEIFKLVVEFKSAEATQVLRNMLGEKYKDEYCVFVAWSFGVEFLAKDANKGIATLKLKEILGDKVKKMICVGDSESDTFMLKCADIGYAVGNASTEAKEAADRITIDYRQGAIAEIIKEIEKEL